MGRMTYSFMNDVFFGKIKSLVVGAIDRARLEDEDLKISYESLVECLDVGDSFTTQLIEVLVKELADRRQRADADKRLISKRTVDGLRDIAKSAQCQRSYNARSRTRTVRAADETAFLTSWGDEHTRYDSVDDDELDDAAENTEGARIDSHHLYDAYRPPPFAPHGRRQGTFLPTPWSTDNADGSRSTLDLTMATQAGPFTRQHLPYGIVRRPTSSRETANASSLTRQSSIRRPVRSRTSDFNDFASRRRSAARGTTLHSTDVPYMADDGWFLARRSPVREEPVVPTQAENMYDSSSSEPSRVRSTLFEPPEPESSRRGTHLDTVEVTDNPWREPPSSLISLSRNLRGSSTVTDAHGFPRLRRGSLRPPVSMLGGSSSLTFPRPEANLTDAPETRTLSSFEQAFGVYLPDDGVASRSDSGPSRRRESTSLPTPRSISPAPAVLRVDSPRVPPSPPLGPFAPLPHERFNGFAD